MLMNRRGIWDDLYEAGYTGIDMNLDDLLSRSSFNVNLFFATETEKNFDMGSIVDSFGNDYREPRLEDIDAESWTTPLLPRQPAGPQRRGGLRESR